MSKPTTSEAVQERKDTSSLAKIQQAEDQAAQIIKQSEERAALFLLDEKNRINEHCASVFEEKKEEIREGVKKLKGGQATSYKNRLKEIDDAVQKMSSIAVKQQEKASEYIVKQSLVILGSAK